MARLGSYPCISTYFFLTALVLLLRPWGSFESPVSLEYSKLWAVVTAAQSFGIKDFLHTSYDLCYRCRRRAARGGCECLNVGRGAVPWESADTLSYVDGGMSTVQALPPHL